ncbi:superinfection immunity protein [Ferrovum myxofaciens]|uniref:superinfection immunity protein n=1 Tax=Ferrovum myxofaciens TaxID=416213 RepID=UPI00190F2E95|nr:superinfection immunity protein [Ferrovum myxofaciens]
MTLYVVAIVNYKTQREIRRGHQNMTSINFEKATFAVVSAGLRGVIAILLSVFTLFYLFPTSLAMVRSHRTGLVFTINFLFGWTVIGWIVSLVIAFGETVQPQNITIVQVVDFDRLKGE